MHKTSMLVKNLTINCTSPLDSWLAQSVETLAYKLKVEGSSPPVTNLFLNFLFIFFVKQHRHFVKKIQEAVRIELPVKEYYSLLLRSKGKHDVHVFYSQRLSCWYILEKKVRNRFCVSWPILPSPPPSFQISWYILFSYKTSNIFIFEIRKHLNFPDFTRA